MQHLTDIYSDLHIDEFMSEEDTLALMYHDPGDEDDDLDYDDDWYDDDDEDLDEDDTL